MYNNNNRRSFGSQRSGYSRPTQQFRSAQRRPARRAKVLDPQLFVKKAENIVVEEYNATHAFSDFAFSAELHRNVQSKGYAIPTPIQDQCIPALLEGRDVIGIAGTGTGKTAAFLLPLIQKVFHNRQHRVLIIAPTRELATQIDDQFRAFSRGMHMYSAVCIGGAHMKRQIEHLRKRSQFVIATPGRLIDFIKQGEIRLSDFGSIVLDEVDRMMDMGFINDIRFIVSHLPEDRQSLFFSATMPEKIESLAHSFLRNPITVKIKGNTSASSVDQDVVRVNGGNKFDMLLDILNQQEVGKTIIFGRTKWGVSKLATQLAEYGFKVDDIHGNKSQNQRQRALDKFKNNTITILLATDVAARGIDVDDITHVINYDAPESYDDYIHRIGRTGRAGRKGSALTFV